MIGLLRFVGLMNAAIWLGATVFFALSVNPAFVSSAEVKELLGPKNFPYFSVALGQIVSAHYFHLYVTCSLVALLYLVAEWLYLGKYPQRAWLALVVGLWVAGLLQAYWIQPRLKEWHRLQFTQTQQRATAGRAFRVWRGFSTTLNVLVVLGLTAYLWRVANPSDTARFVSATKFRS